MQATRFTSAVGVAGKQCRTSSRHICRANTATIAKLDLRKWLALNVTRANLIESQGGRTTRNIDGVVYEITYNPSEDRITVADMQRGLSYPVAVGEDLRIRINPEAPEPIAVSGFAFEPLQQVLKGDSPGAEAINGRAAMIGFLACALYEIVTGVSVAQQLGSPVGAGIAAIVSTSITLASVAPAIAGKVPAQNVFPSENDSYADRLLPYVWNPLAEKLNGRVAIIGFAGLVINELIRGAPLL